MSEHCLSAAAEGRVWVLDGGLATQLETDYNINVSLAGVVANVAPAIITCPLSLTSIVTYIAGRPAVECQIAAHQPSGHSGPTQEVSSLH